MEKHRPNEEAAVSNFEIYHTAGYDVVLSPDIMVNPIEIAEIVDTLSRCSNPTEASGEVVPELVANGQRYYIKQRWWSTQDQRKMYEEDLLQSDVRSFGSILNELKLSPAVLEIVSSQEVQELAKKFGFSKFEFVPAVGGVVRKDDTTRFIIYPFKDLVPPYKTSIPEERFEEIEEALRGVFERHNINPIDLGGNLCVDANSSETLVLTDIEGFRFSKEIDDKNNP